MKPKFYLFAIFIMIPILLGVIVFRSNNIIVDYEGQGSPTQTVLRSLEVGDNLSGKVLTFTDDIKQIHNSIMNVSAWTQILMINTNTYYIGLIDSPTNLYNEVQLKTKANLFVISFINANGVIIYNKTYTLPSDFGVITSIVKNDIKIINETNYLKVYNSIKANLPMYFPNLSHGKIYHDTLNNKYYEYQIDRWVEFQ